VFKDQLKGLNRQEIRHWYNGYNWLGTSVYNPFDLLLLFENRKYQNYWFETGTPTFLVKFILDRKTYLPDLSRLNADEEMMSSIDIDDIPVEAMLFQSGYLTIDEEINLGGNYFYKLRYPNNEVFKSLNGSLLKGLLNQQSNSKIRSDLYCFLADGDMQGLQNTCHAFFASIPNDWYRNNPIAQYEGYYASVFYGYFAALGLDIRLEDSTNQGRIDMTVCLNEKVYIFEFKVVDSKPDGSALKQIKNRNYADKYTHQNKIIYLIGVEFSKETRNVCAFDAVCMA
jgi:PD-(D/E)XK nuclease superfamily